MKPYFWFPVAGERRYFWGSAMRLEAYRELGEECGREGVVELAPSRTLSTVLDAGDRGGFGADLFSGFVKCAVDDGYTIAGPSWLAAGANVRFGRLP